MSYDALGQIITPSQVETEVQAHLQYWMPLYIAKVEADDGRPARSVAQIAAWERKTIKSPEVELPAIVVVNQGVTGSPKKRDEGKIQTTWVVGVLCYAMADTWDNSRSLVGLYASAVYGLMAQHPSVSGFADDTRWVGASFDPLGGDDDRYLAAATVIFQVDVPAVVDTRAGVLEAPNDPYVGVPDLQTPLTHHLEVDKK